MTTTTVISGGESKGNKPVSIMLMVFGTLGIVFAIISIIYSGTGLNIALEGSGVEALQQACLATYDAVGVENSQRCGMDVAERGLHDVEYLGGERMCGLKQEIPGCSYDDHKAGFQVATAIGLGATIAGSFFVIIASIPVLINGVYGFKNKEVAAKVSGGFGVGCSIPGVLGASICTIVCLIGIGGATIADTFIRDEYSDLDLALQPCNNECQLSIEATKELGNHIIGYYEVLTLLMFIMVILALIESILACVSCCFWKKQALIVTTTVAPAVVAAPVVAQPAPVVKVES